MADVKPFRAVRYSGAAGPLGDLVAPPYDTVSAEEREQLYTRCPFNVVHLTLPDSAEEAGRLYRRWLADGILTQDASPATWLLAEDFVGPDGIERERRGIVVSLAAEPYASGSILPHERTHSQIKDERLHLLRETHVQAEPIFVLVDRGFGVEAPEARPDVEVGGARLWRLAHADPRALVEGTQLLIADGHHRYESAIDFGAANGGSSVRIMALLVSTEDPGLHVFPTHRTFSGRADLRDASDGEPIPSLDEALARLADETHTRSAAVAYRVGHIELVQGREGELDVELVDRLGLDGISYTPRLEEAVAAVDAGGADVAFLLRAPRVEDVFTTARLGRRLPQKSTYFFPKPLSGLLFHPVEP